MGETSISEAESLPTDLGRLSYIPLAEFDRVRQANADMLTRVRCFADMARLNTLYMITRAGSGHIGSSFSSMEVVAYLHLEKLKPGRDLYFSSKGHDAPGLYAALIGLGRLPFDKLHQLRRLHGLPGHPDVHTPEMVANTGSLGMGISKAKGMLQAARLKGEALRVFVMTGDGELQEGQFWESLVSAANHKLANLYVIVDHNKLQSDTFVSRVSHLGDLEAKLAAFGWQVERCDGHDIAALERAFSRLDAVADKPKILIADTVKGQGVSFMAATAMGQDEEFYRFHSGAPRREDYRRAEQELIAAISRQFEAMQLGDLQLDSVEVPVSVLAAEKKRLIPAYSEALIEAAENNPTIVALDADLILDTGLIPFRDRFPDRFIECGIAEQDMVSQASGIALQGLLPVVHSFACFLTARPNEQIYNTATEGRKVIYVGSLAGLLPGGPGHSHQAVRDIAAMAAMPDLICLQPGSPQEVKHAVQWAVSGTASSSYIRLTSIPCDIPFELPQDYRLELGKGFAVRQGDGGAVVIAYGPVMLAEACKAADRLRSDSGLHVGVINLPWLNRIDAAWLRQVLSGAALAVVLDDHYLAGGLGERIGAAMALDRSIAWPRLVCMGVTEIPACGSNDEVLAAHRLSAADIAARLQEELRRS